MTAFFNSPAIKAKAMAQLRQHQELDEIIQGRYWSAGRGCHLGCLTHTRVDVARATERMFGIPMEVARILEMVFEGLADGEYQNWVIEATDAIPVGADLSKLHYQLAAWVFAVESGFFDYDAATMAFVSSFRELHRRAVVEDVPREEWQAFGRDRFGAVVGDCNPQVFDCLVAGAAAAISDSVRVWRLIKDVVDIDITRPDDGGQEGELDISERNQTAYRKIGKKVIELLAASPVPDNQPQETT